MQGGACRLGPNTPSIISQRHNHEREELKFMRAAECVCAQQFMFGSTGRVIISRVQACQVSRVVVSQRVPLNNVTAAVTVPARENKTAITVVFAERCKHFAVTQIS